MNFQELLKDLGIPIAPEHHHHARTGWIQFDCPFCGRDNHKWYMGYSINGNFINCWRCGTHNIKSTIQQITGLSFHKVSKMVGGLDKTRIKDIKKSGKLKLPTQIHSFTPNHIDYLTKRNFDFYHLQRLWDIAGIGHHPTLPWRIFIPIKLHGQTVSWTTRTIDTSMSIQPRYISAEETEEDIPHKKLLYGEDYARHAIIIVEGCTDVWRIGPGAVSTFGSGYSQAQILRMLKYPVRAVCFDPEPEAQKRAKKLYNDLAGFDGDTYLISLDQNDPAESDTKTIERIRKTILS